MVLSDYDIEKHINLGLIKIEPYKRKHLQPASVDLTLYPEIRLFEKPQKTQTSMEYIDTRNMSYDLTTAIPITKFSDKGYFIKPGEFILGCTNEVITVPNNLAAKLEGKSSLARISLIVHHTGGWIDPGFSGRITLEISNHLNIPILLYPDMPICQIGFMTMMSPARTPYGHKDLYSRYQGQMVPTPSKTKERFRDE